MLSTKRSVAQANTNAILPPKKKKKGKDNRNGNAEKVAEMGVGAGNEKAESMEMLTKRELMEILKRRGLSSSGTKEELVGRLRGEGQVEGDGINENEATRVGNKDQDGRKALATVKNKGSACATTSNVDGSSATTSTNTSSSPKQSADQNRMEFATKDSSKLRTLLRDWRVMQPEEVENMDRVAMIERLESHVMRGHGDVYEHMSSGELSELLKSRGLYNRVSRNKKQAIERLRMDDGDDRDTGNHDEMSTCNQDKRADVMERPREEDGCDREEARLAKEASEGGHAEKADEGNDGEDEMDPTVEPSMIGNASANDLIYAKKDNSKLRALLRDRHLQVSGTRDEMIHRLETSPYHYESYSAEELSLILKDRRLVNADYGNKESKIERIKNNDRDYYDSANLKDTKLYVQLELGESWIKEKEEALKALSDPSISYESLDSRALSELAKALGVSANGEHGAVIKRLQANDKKMKLGGNKAIVRDAIQKLTASLKEHKEKYSKARQELEESTGHSILSAAAVMKQYEGVSRRDSEIVDSYQPARKARPQCDYDWKDSQWADKSTRDLADICERRGMTVIGTKASMIKYIETGEIDYEALYVDALKAMCTQRGIKYKHNELRLDLAKKLRETDGKEVAYRDLGVTALRKTCKERGMNVKAGELKQDLVTRLRQADENVGRS